MSQPAYIPLSVPCLQGNEERYVTDCIRTNWISSVGSYVDRFEAAFAEYVGAPHAVAVVNGTAALHLSLLTAGVERGDLVAVPAVTFIAPVNAIRYVGADPLFVDLDPVTLGFDPASFESWLTAECELRDGCCRHRATGRCLRAIIPVHLYGHSCAMDDLQALAERWRLILIEDAAEGIGCRYRDRHVGTFGRTGCFSFNGNKILTTGGGGMIVTSDEALARRVRHLSTQAKSDPVLYVHDEVGYNYRLTNILAAVGVAQLEQLPTMLARKAQIHHRYEAAFAALPGARLITPLPTATCNYWMALLQVPPSRLQPLADHIAAARIQARPIWGLNHLHPMYADCLTTTLTNSQRFVDETLCLPCHQGMSDDDVQRVIDAVTRFFAP